MKSNATRLAAVVVVTLMFVVMPALLCLELLRAEDPKARLRLSEYSFDLGVIIQGETYTRDFTVFNDGDFQLQIYELEPSCGCISIESYTEFVAPGETGKISILIDPRKLKVPKDSVKKQTRKS